MRYRKQSFELNHQIRDNSIGKNSREDLSESKKFDKNNGSMLKSPSIQFIGNAPNVLSHSRDQSLF